MSVFNFININFLLCYFQMGNTMANLKEWDISDGMFYCKKINEDILELHITY